MMKKFFLSAMLLVSGILCAQDAVITFQSTEHDFGQINEADGRVTTVFEFKNEGMAPLVLSNVRASCGCTTPKWTKEPVEPGQIGQITVTYNPNGRPGRFQKTITVTSNATEATKKLYIKGEVIPKTQQAANKYPIQMGVLNLAGTTINFGTVKNTGEVVKTLEYTNNTDKPITVDINMDGVPAWMAAQVSLATIKPKEVGQIQVKFFGNEAKIWGQSTSYAYVVVNGKLEKTDAFKLALTANLEEDFSTLSAKDKQRAPIFEMPSHEINLGKVKAGQILKGSFSFKNVGGGNPMLIRTINNTNKQLKLSYPKSVKNNKSAVVKVEFPIDKDQKSGSFRKQIEVVVNDPNAPKQRVILTYTVE